MWQLLTDFYKKKDNLKRDMKALKGMWKQEDDVLLKAVLI